MIHKFIVDNYSIWVDWEAQIFFLIYFDFRIWTSQMTSYFAIVAHGVIYKFVLP